jgi:outer membrane protein
VRNAVIGLLALAFCLVSTNALALKVGVVDIEYVVVKSNKGKAAKKRLKKIFEKKQKTLDAKQKALLSLKGRIENQSSVVTPDARRKMFQEYQAGLSKLQEELMKNQKELAGKEQDLMKPIFKKLKDVLDTYAASAGLDLILARSQHGVLFSKEAMDITQAILKQMNK